MSKMTPKKTKMKTRWATALSFLLGILQLNKEELKNQKEKEEKVLDPNKRYKRVLKRVKYEGRDSVSSHSSVESDYQSINDNESDRPGTICEEAMKISDKSVRFYFIF